MVDKLRRQYSQYIEANSALYLDLFVKYLKYLARNEE